MGTNVKPVQPTEIMDKKIAREVIKQIRKPIPASVYKRHEEKPPTLIRCFASEQPDQDNLQERRRLFLS
jgi:hypothetical protein